MFSLHFYMISTATSIPFLSSLFIKIHIADTLFICDANYNRLLNVFYYNEGSWTKEFYKFY
jgi:hypothetical protein